MKFYIEVFFENLSKNSSFIKIGENERYFTLWPTHIAYHISVSSS